jgi:hypothetical protein
MALASLGDYNDDDDDREDAADFDAAVSDEVLREIATINEAARAGHRMLTPAEKRKISNLRRKTKAINDKDKLLANPLNSPWLQFEMIDGAGVYWCELCHNHPSVTSNKDKLATCKAPVSRMSRFKKHWESPHHITVLDMIKYETYKAAHVSNHITITKIDVLLARTIESLAWICQHKQGNSLLLPILELQHRNGAVVSFDHCHSTSVEGLLSAGVKIFKEMQFEDAVPAYMRALFPHGIPFSYLLDGTVDASKHEVEDLELVMMGHNGKPRCLFGELFELDLSKS